MLKLCGFAISNYYNKVKIALLEKGVPFEEVYCEVSQEAGMLARSPMGKVPFIEVDGRTLCESQVICEYLEDAYPAAPLYPKDFWERAQVRELITVLELHLELPARRLYPKAFFGGELTQETKTQVEKDLAKGVRAFKQLAKFSPFVAGGKLTLADCAAGAHLQLMSLATKIALGRDAFEDFAAVKPYLKMLNERPAFRKTGEARKAAVEERAAKSKT